MYPAAPARDSKAASICSCCTLHECSVRLESRPREPHRRLGSQICRYPMAALDAFGSHRRGTLAAGSASGTRFRSTGTSASCRRHLPAPDTRRSRTDRTGHLAGASRCSATRSDSLAPTEPWIPRKCPRTRPLNQSLGRAVAIPCLSTTAHRWMPGQCMGMPRRLSANRNHPIRARQPQEILWPDAGLGNIPAGVAGLRRCNRSRPLPKAAPYSRLVIAERQDGRASRGLLAFGPGCVQVPLAAGGVPRHAVASVESANLREKTNAGMWRTRSRFACHS